MLIYVNIRDPGNEIDYWRMGLSSDGWPRGSWGWVRLKQRRFTQTWPQIYYQLSRVNARSHKTVKGIRHSCNFPVSYTFAKCIILVGASNFLLRMRFFKNGGMHQLSAKQSIDIYIYPDSKHGQWSLYTYDLRSSTSKISPWVWRNNIRKPPIRYRSENFVFVFS